jgi:hypothetical protein
MCDRRRKCGKIFHRGSALPEKLFFRRLNPRDVIEDIIDDDIEEIRTDGISPGISKQYFKWSEIGGRDC